MSQTRSLPCLYVACDMELDGPNIRQNSMLSMAFRCRTPRGVAVGKPFDVNLKLRPGATFNINTMDFWYQYPKAYDDWALGEKHAPAEAMHMFKAWLTVTTQGYTPILLSDAIGCEWEWLNAY
ncbi:MAG: hypothetical protein WAX89_02065, partial [Alphaproteobacteria bacterium]